jgi:hypothetical protein
MRFGGVGVSDGNPWLTTAAYPAPDVNDTPNVDRNWLESCALRGTAAPGELLIATKAASSKVMVVACAWPAIVNAIMPTTYLIETFILNLPAREITTIFTACVHNQISFTSL